MEQSQRVEEERKVVLEYASPDGPRVRAVRGFVFQSRLAYLRESDRFEAYLEKLAEPHRETFTQALASAWVPVDAVMAHYAALDALGLGEAQLVRTTEVLVPTLYQTVFAALLRLIRVSDRRAWAGLRQADRVVSRLYQGGGAIVTQTGPRAALYELTGFPFADSRAFRLAHCEFMRAATNLNAQHTVVREVPSGKPRTERYAVSVSWS